LGQLLPYGQFHQQPTNTQNNPPIYLYLSVFNKDQAQINTKLRNRTASQVGVSRKSEPIARLE